jgi:hypothetical protein
MVDQFSAAPTHSIPQVCGSVHEAKAAYRFLDNERVTHAAILAGQRQATLERAQQYDRILLDQDTSSFNFSHHPGAEGMGPLENLFCRGFLVHTTLAVSTTGVPIGVLEQQVWVRSDEEAGKSEKRHERPFAEKESYKWVTGLPSDETLAQLPQPVVVSDAESHIYEFLDTVFERGIDFLVRAADARSFTPEGQALFEAVAQKPAQHSFTLSLRRRPDREAREAKVELRFDPITLRRPTRAATASPTLTMWVVDVFEPDPPLGEKPIHWLLLTSVPVETIAEAQQITDWYTYRWLIERFHFALKSGCKLEERQLREQKRLERLLAVFNLVAWKLLWLTYQARLIPEEPCTVVLETEEWQALYVFMNRNKRLPKAPPSLHQAVRWIGQLGGFLGRKGDGEPGVKVLWRGWTRLQDIVETWKLFNLLPTKDVGNV